MKIKIQELPEKQINTSINPVDPSQANAEIEKGEIILDPETLLLHKATGKRHSQGGTPVNLKSNTFIFSDFKNLSFNKSDKEQMEFKTTTTKKKDNTPAKILQKELAGGIKHHNKMLNILNNPHKNDGISQQTAQLMLQKNLEKIGQIAYKQEEKKMFPDGLPEVSQGTAPLYSSNIEKDIIQAEQFDPYQKKEEYQIGGFYNFNPRKMDRWLNKPAKTNARMIVSTGNMFGDQPLYSTKKQTNRDLFLQNLSNEPTQDQNPYFNSFLKMGNPIVTDPSSPFYKTMNYKPSFQAAGTFNPDDWYKKYQEILEGYDPRFFGTDQLNQPAPKGVFTKEQTPGSFAKAVNNLNKVFSGELGTDLTPENIRAYQEAVYQRSPQALNEFYNSKTPAIKVNNKTPKVAPDTFMDGLYNRDRVQYSYITGKSIEDIDNNAKKAGLKKVGDDYVFANGEQPTIFKPLVTNTPQVDLSKINPEALNFTQRRPEPLKGVEKEAPQEQTQKPLNTPQQGSTPFSPTRYNVGLTPWQKLNLAKGMADALGVKTYMPIRQHQESVLTTPDLISAQPQISQANQAYFNAAQLNRVNTSPQMSIAANQQLAGQRLDNINNILGQIQNQNVGILNQSRERNAAVLNQDAQQNRAFDNDYYNKTVTALQNRDDEREYRWNNVINEANQYFAENQALNNQLNSLPQYKTAIRDKKGNIIGYRGGLPYEPTKGFFGYGFRYNPNMDAQSLLNSNAGAGSNPGIIALQQLDKEMKANPATSREQAYSYNTRYNMLKSMYGLK